MIREHPAPRCWSWFDLVVLLLSEVAPVQPGYSVIGRCKTLCLDGCVPFRRAQSHAQHTVHLVWKQQLLWRRLLRIATSQHIFPPPSFHYKSPPSCSGFCAFLPVAFSPSPHSWQTYTVLWANCRLQREAVKPEVGGAWRASRVALLPGGHVS